MICFSAAIDYESSNFWVAIASLTVAIASLVVAVVSLFLSKASVRIAESSLVQASEAADGDQRDWMQRKWFDLYVAADHFRTLLERLQVIYEKPLPTLEFEKDSHDVVFAMRDTLALASVIPKNPTVDKFFGCINKFDRGKQLLSKELLQEFIDAIEGFRQKTFVHESVLGGQVRRCQSL